MKNALALLLTIGLVACAQAGVVEDFENWTGVGTPVADPDDAGNTVLALAPGEVVELALSESEGTVTMDIYDFGESVDYTVDSAFGPRWAIEGINTGDGSAASVGLTIIYRATKFDSNQGYGYSAETSRTGSWFSPSFFGGPRQCTLETLVGGVGQDDGQGQWTTWSFTVESDGSTTLSAPFGGSVEDPGTSKTAYWDNVPISVPNMNKVWISGGRASLPLGPVASGTYAGYAVLVDNITLSSATPEYIDGDANGDGVVNLDDFIILKQNYGAGTTWAQGDFNGDGTVNLDDFIILKQNYGNTSN